MTQTLKIRFPIDPSDPEAHALYGMRIWQFYEDVFRMFRDSGLAEVDLQEVDKAFAELTVRVKSRTKIRRCIAMIREEADRQFPDIHPSIHVGEAL